MVGLTKYFEELSYLRTAVEQGSINRAASLIGISQPALTRRIKRLELYLGVRVLDRTARGVFPTPFGEALVNHTRSIDAELERAKSAIDMLKGGVGGQIRCGGTIGSLNLLMPMALNELQRSRPNIHARIVEGVPATLMAMLRLGELDVIVCSKSDDLAEPDLVAHSIGRDQIDIFARRGHRLHGRRDNSIKTLVESASWILPNVSAELYKVIQREFAALQLEMPKKFVETSSSVMLRALLRTTEHIAVTTMQTVASELEDGSVLQLHGDWKPIETKTVAYHRADATPAPATTSLIRSLQRAARHRSYAQVGNAAVVG
jgi:DNA-binding transcriptional LysR family regulator